jgi:hypothetical protein
VRGEWLLVCLAYNIKRLHTLLSGAVPAPAPLAQIAAPVAALLVPGAAWLGRLFYYRLLRVCAPSPALAHATVCLGGVAFSPTGC